MSAGGKARVLLFGSGAREHALAYALSKSERVGEVIVAPGNAGTSRMEKIKNYDLPFVSKTALLEMIIVEISHLCDNLKPDLVVITEERLLAENVAALLTEDGFKVFGPGMYAAKIEWSKAWAKTIMKKYNIPTASYMSFSDAESLRVYLEQNQPSDFVVKLSGLAEGKGVKVCKDYKNGINFLHSVAGVAHTHADKTFLLEDKLEGTEVSALAFTDGHTVKMMPLVQDHKRRYAGDQGPNTGGMGAYCPFPFCDENTMKYIENNVLQAVITALRKENISYVGVIYAGLILTTKGPYVLEFNCRFGDPEAQALVPLMDFDLYEVMKACADGKLGSVHVPFAKNRSSCAVFVVDDMYPGGQSPESKVTGLDSCLPNSYYFHSKTRIAGEDVISSGGRVICATSWANDLATAILKAREAASLISFKNATYRKDIGLYALARLKAQQGDNYKEAGVDLKANDVIVQNIKSMLANEASPSLIKGVGHFGAVYDIQYSSLQDPLLVAGTDGVGTKLKIAIDTGDYSGIGIDLVAMCVNDIMVHGAEPLFFLDYFSSGKLQPPQVAAVIASIVEGCRQSKCILVGGETAEMPGFYRKKEFDVAGFAVGVVEREELLPKDNLTSGDILVAIPSSGLHSNGFSLVRKIVESLRLQYTQKSPFDPSKSLGEVLLTPTRIYSELLPLARRGMIKAAVHITGGGITGNLARILPDTLFADVEVNWEIPPVFGWLALNGVNTESMASTFNLGIGMILVVEESLLDKFLAVSHDFIVAGKLLQRSTAESRPVVLHLEAALFKTMGELVQKYPEVCPFTSKEQVAVIISGKGTNMEVLIEHASSPHSRARIALVISDKANAGGLGIAKLHDIPVKVLSYKNGKQEAETAISQCLEDHGIAFICLAGFMRILSTDFICQWRGRILNIHPSLLPSFKGLHAPRQALEAGVTVTGCTAHFVTEVLDSGKIILQEAVSVLPDDNEETLQERIKEAEHRIYPRALEMVLSGEKTVED